MRSRPPTEQERTPCRPARFRPEMRDRRNPAAVKRNPARRAAGRSGQAVLEFAVMAAAAALLALTVLVLLRAFSGNGERMVELVKMNVP